MHALKPPSPPAPPPGQVPLYQQPPPDPLLAQIKAQAQASDVLALQGRASSDTSSLMARYGTLAFAGGSTPMSLAAPSPATPSTLPFGQAMNLIGMMGNTFRGGAVAARASA